MKPLYLSVKGFGPYIKAEIKEEDFQFLTENKLFLISGEVGAGKTTLFDAIVYALYGESTIEGRNPADLISHFIKNKPNIFPEVNFKFFLDGKTYKIIRRPSYMERAESVSLWIEDKLFSTKKVEIKSKIKELIGLDANQFKKVFLIPQGEYRKILIAKKEEREALLETIFETFIFSQLEEFLKNKIKELKELYQSLIEREEDLKKISQVSYLEELEIKIENLEKKLRKLEKEAYLLISKKNKLEKEIKELENDLQLYNQIKEFSHKLEKLKSKEKEIQNKEELLKKLKILKDYLPFYETFKTLQQELKDTHHKKKILLNTYKKIKEDLENLIPEISILDQGKKDIENKKSELQKLKELESIFKEKEKLENKLKEISFVMGKESEILKNLQEEIKNLKTEIEKAYEEKDKLNQTIILLREKSEINKIIKGFTEYEDSIIKSQEIQKTINKLENICKELERIKEDLEIKNRAQFLARFLKKGEPCPVCGSPYHPNPIKTENFVEELEKIQKELTKKKEFVEKEKQNLYTIKGKIKNLEELIKDKNQKELQKRYEFIEKELCKFPKEYLEKIMKDSPENLNLLWENKVQNLKTKLTFLEKKETEEKETVERLKNEEKLIQGKLSYICEVLKNYDSFEVLRSKIRNLESEVETWEYKKNSLEKKKNILSEEKIKIEADLKNVENFLRRNFSEHKKMFLKLNTLKKNGFINSINDFEIYKTSLSQIKNLEEEIQNYYNELVRTEKNLEEVTKALKTSEGKILDVNLVSQELNSKIKEKQHTEEVLGKTNKQIGSLTQELSHLKEILISYNEIKREKKLLEKEYPLLEALYNLIVGKNKKGVSFHSFVLSVFTQLILKRANFYFKEFSFGRYKFVEDEILQKKFILEVFDHYTGSKRETKTLSGGESFLATLSLALGTSDVILYLYRLRPFESLFIDEGFGSLDENTLEKVVSMLLNLAHGSGRIIGIISHLKELKDKFPAVLEVYKNQLSGSYIKIKKSW